MESQQAGAQAAPQSLAHGLFGAPHPQGPFPAEIPRQSGQQAALIRTEGYGFEILAAVSQAFQIDTYPCLRIEDCQRRSEEHTSELQSLRHLVCRLLLEK